MAILSTTFRSNSIIKHPTHVSSTHPQQDDLVPNEVVGYMVKEGLSLAAAWRKHLGLSQAEVAGRIGITKSAYAQQEAAANPRKATREKIAAALGIAPELLDI